MVSRKGEGPWTRMNKTRKEGRRAEASFESDEDQKFEVGEKRMKGNGMRSGRQDCVSKG